MPNSRQHRILALTAGVLALCATPSSAQAQSVQTTGFGLERYYSSAPGGAWLVMDDLDLQGGLGGAMAMTLVYASNPLRVTDGVNRVAVVSSQALLDIGAAITWDRWRFYLNIDSPIVITGDSGTVGRYTFTGPSVNPGANPDRVSQARVGADVRIVGEPGSRLRLGIGAQLLIPNGSRSDYDTDGTFAAMLRALVAGDGRHFSYAGHLGVHIRPLDDSPIPGSPAGSELLFGLAAGVRLPVGETGSWTVVVGPEVFGATAFSAFADSNDTALEGLLSARIEGVHDERMQVRLKLGVGGGLHQRFGAPEWRAVFGLEIFNRNRRP